MSWIKRHWWAVGLFAALAVAFLSPLASPHPDGLERVAEDKGFIQRAREAPFAILPDYVLPGVQNEGVATILAGIVGTLVVFGLVYGLAWALRRRSAHAAR
jgi:hypothetical protein